MSEQLPPQIDPKCDETPQVSIPNSMSSLPGGDTFCGIAAAVAILGDAWVLLLARDLVQGPRRFTELQTSTGISARVLTDRLRSMAGDGLITRTMFDEVPLRVEYALTAKGRAITPVLDALRTYGEEWLRPKATVEP